MYAKIQQELNTDTFYQQNFSNDGVRFVAWYLRRVLLRGPSETRQEINDGAGDKQVDAVVVDDENRRVIVVQGKFVGNGTVDGEAVREVLGAWMRLRDLKTLQQDCNQRLRERIEAVRRALDDEYELEFELLTTGTLTPSAQADLTAFVEQLESFDDFPATARLVDSGVLRTRLAEAEGAELPTIDHDVKVDPTRMIQLTLKGTRSVLAAVSLAECLKLPGITDGRLFRKNVRQSLGSGNKVNKGLRATLYSDRARDFFLYHNGITALCREFEVSEDRGTVRLKDLSVVNGCQSLTTIYAASERIRALPPDEAFILFRFYEIPQRDRADRISVNTNSQSAVKPRDLRSNDKTMLALKKAYEATYRDGFFVSQRGSRRPAGCDDAKTVDCAELARALMAWQCQRPNTSYNEKKLFDEHYRTLFKDDYSPASILALQTWLNAIDTAFPNLTLNDTLRALRGHSRFHLLHAVSALIAHASGHGDKVPKPSATLALAQSAAADILPLAVNCVNKALESANQEAATGGKVFSPQNWLKNRASVQGATLVASTMIGMLPSIGGQATVTKLSVPPVQFELRWSAD